MSILPLYRSWLEPNRYVWSPSVVKLEARLRIAGTSYKTALGSVRTAPKSTNNQSSAPATIGDSTVIIKHVTERGCLQRTNVLKVLSSNYSLYRRFYSHLGASPSSQTAYTIRDHVLSAVTYPIRILVCLLIYCATVQTLHGQGKGRYSAEEIQGFREEAWGAVDDLLVAFKDKARNHGGPSWVLSGEKPTEADATGFGFGFGLIWPKTKELVMGLPQMREYAKRIHDAYFLDYEWVE
ncbi:hypothetical protein BDW68DRAFT_188589 [Aspergillus falconensis]